jgi:hypothetical protein
LRNKRIINELKTIIVMPAPRIISKSLANLFRKANSSVDPITVNRFKTARTTQRDTKAIYEKKATKFYASGAKRTRKTFRTIDSAAKINAKKVIERKEAFSDLIAARKATKSPLTAIEKKAIKLTRGTYKGDFCSFESYSGGIYEGTFRRITTTKVRTPRGIQNVLSIEILPSGGSKTIKLAVDRLERRN